MYERERFVRVDPEEADEISRVHQSIDGTVRTEREGRVRGRAFGSSEGMERADMPVRIDLEDHPETIGAAGSGGAVQVAVGAHRQRAERRSAVVHVKRVECLERAIGKN